MGVDAPPAVDTTPPLLMSSTPADNGTKVGALSKLTFVFNEALAPATVTEASVAVTYMNGNYPTRIKGVVTYDDATHTVTFAPKLPMLLNLQHRIHLAASVTDVAGNAFAGGDLAFVTSVNQTTKQVYYNTSTGQVNSWYAYVLDANGRQSKNIYYNATGPDGQWFTGDDVVGSRSDYNYSPTGQILDQRYFSAGPDTLYNTADDVITNFYKYIYDASGRQTEYSGATGPGPDTMWGTADDTISYLATYQYETGLVRNLSFSAAGNDGVWRTADDRVSSFYEYSYNGEGLRTRIVGYNPGADQLAKTGDDTVSYYYDFDYDPATYTMTAQKQRTVGTDNMWFTADDGYSFVVKYELDANGVAQNYFQYNAPGTDGVWLTADDVIGYRQSMTSDANKLQTSLTYYNGPGADNTYNTADDVIGGYYTYTYDQTGSKTDYKSYQAPGADNVWKTGDDRLGYDADYDLAH